MGDDIEIIASRLTGHTFGPIGGLVLRIGLLLLVAALFVTFIGPVASLVGQYLGGVFIHSIATTPP